MVAKEKSRTGVTMSLALDPFVQNKLDEFITRRRRWTIIQATLIGLAVWLVGILLFTWADAVWVLDRPVRLVLSLLVYVAAAIAGVDLGAIPFQRH